MYECIGCGKKFETTRWSSRHQNTCKTYKSLLKAGAQKFRKAQGVSQAPRNLLSTFNSWISGDRRTQNLDEPAAGVGEIAHIFKLYQITN